MNAIELIGWLGVGYFGAMTIDTIWEAVPV